MIDNVLSANSNLALHRAVQWVVALATTRPVVSPESIKDIHLRPGTYQGTGREYPADHSLFGLFMPHWLSELLTSIFGLNSTLSNAFATLAQTKLRERKDPLLKE